MDLAVIIAVSRHLSENSYFFWPYRLKQSQVGGLGQPRRIVDFALDQGTGVIPCAGRHQGNAFAHIGDDVPLNAEIFHSAGSDFNPDTIRIAGGIANGVVSDCDISAQRCFGHPLLKENSRRGPGASIAKILYVVFLNGYILHEPAPNFTDNRQVHLELSVLSMIERISCDHNIFCYWIVSIIWSSNNSDINSSCIVVINNIICYDDIFRFIITKSID